MIPAIKAITEVAEGFKRLRPFILNSLQTLLDDLELELFMGGDDLFNLLGIRVWEQALKACDFFPVEVSLYDLLAVFVALLDFDWAQTPLTDDMSRTHFIQLLVCFFNIASWK